MFTLSFSPIRWDLPDKYRCRPDPKRDSYALRRRPRNAFHHHNVLHVVQSFQPIHTFDRMPSRSTRRNRWMLCSRYICTRPIHWFCSPTGIHDGSCAILRRMRPKQLANFRLDWYFCETKKAMSNRINLSVVVSILLVVRTCTVHVRHRVHEECNVQCDGEA